MKGTNNYDLAVNSFYEDRKIVGMPLLSWDIYSLFLEKLNRASEDLTSLHLLAKNNKWETTWDFKQELVKKDLVIVVTDTRLNIEYSSQNIYKMNGYKSLEVIGNKPNMFQGGGTCKKTTKKIREAIKNNLPFEATVLNYRKDGSTYNCWIQGHPVYNKKGDVVNFIAFEKLVA